MRTLIIVAASFALMAAGQYFRAHGLENALNAEKAAHARTRAECDGWAKATLAARANAEALAENARACLEREAKAQADARERAAIMAQAKPKERSETEKSRVVDDATRRRAVERLNRGL